MITDSLDQYIKEAVNATNSYSVALINPGNFALKTTEIGSGTFMIMGRERGILTNHHVAEMFFKANYVCVPNQESKLERLPFFEIIFLPKLNDSPSFESPDVDMAFIVLSDSTCNIILEKLNKQFWDLNRSAREYKENSYKKNENSLWIIHGNVDEGKEKDYINQVLFYKNAGPYIVVPDLDNIKFGVCNYGGNQVRIDNTICPIRTSECVPTSFAGMSGAALWQITFNQKDKVQRVLLYGVATTYKKDTYIVCKGPVTLYYGFYSFVLGALYGKYEKMRNGLIK